MLYLASNSPRRKDILNMLGVKFKLIKNNFNEAELELVEPSKFVMDSSYQKALSACHNVENGVILGADTIVYFDNMIFGKPEDKKDAVRMLKLLRNNKHTVYTGITFIKVLNGKIVDYKSGYEKTDVYFSDFDDELIYDYISSKDSPMDKAASYGIQDKGALFIKKINGCFYNVVGLPVNLFVSLKSKLNNM